MNPHPQFVTEWNQLFIIARDALKSFAEQQWPLEPDGSGHPRQVAFHRLCAAFPLSTDVLLFDTAGINTPWKQGPLAAAFRSDFSQPNTLSVRFHGTIPFAQIHDHAKLINSVLRISTESLSAVD